MDEAKVLYYIFKHEENETNATHYKKFKSVVEAIEHLGGVMFKDDTLFSYEK